MGQRTENLYPARLCNNARFVLPANLNLVDANVPEKRRINNNEFWWHLIERLGFCAGRIKMRKGSKLAFRITSAEASEMVSKLHNRMRAMPELPTQLERDTLLTPLWVAS